MTAKTVIHIEIDNGTGLVAYRSNVSTLESLGVLQGIIFNICRNASAGSAGRPPGSELPGETPGSPGEASGRNRAPGFIVRQVDH